MLQVMSGEDYQKRNEFGPERDTVHDVCMDLANAIFKQDGKAYWIPKKLRNGVKRINLDPLQSSYFAKDFYEVLARDEDLRKRFIRLFSKDFS